MGNKLKCPFPYFGGKSKIARLVWDRFGDVGNYVEPFAGSLAVLLARPTPPKVETVNDLDCYLANFWRATQHDPESVAEFCNWPVNEADLHARHRHLVLSEEAADFRTRMRTDPDYYNVRLAGWWCWGLCCWIGGGWCQTGESAEWQSRPLIAAPGATGGRGVNGNGTSASSQMPKLSSSDGVPSTPSELPQKMPNCDGRGDAASALSQQVPRLGARFGQPDLPGVLNPAGPLQRPVMDNGRGGHPAHSTGRPQLADAYDVGRGVNSHGEYGTCHARKLWLLDWFGRLRDRLRLVRVCCGDWSRVCSSESVTTRLGVTGVFLDPPYSAEAGRDMRLYAQESGAVAHEVREWCLSQTGDRLMRVCLAGYEGEGHERLERAGWKVVEWKAQGGYANRGKNRGNRARERLWFSPGCRHEATLFDREEP